jgi:phage tail sheath protein FI
MSTAYNVPGVYVTESPLTALTVTNGGVAAAAFFGTAARGPVTPTLVSDWASYTTLFGPIEDQYDLGYAVYHYFTNGGRSCYVTRVAATAAVAASATAAGAGGVEWTPAAGSAVTLFDVTANSVGTWGNTVSVSTLAGSIPPSATRFGSFTVVVTMGGVEVERWVDCDLSPASSRFVVDVVNSYSSFVTASNVNPANDTPSATDAYLTSAVPLTLGTDGTLADADYLSSFDTLDVVVGSLIINVPGIVATAVVSAAITKAASRNDSFVIVDPNKSDTTLAAVQATSANFASVADKGYAAVYAPALKMVDPAKSGPTAVRVTAPGGAIAGLYVRSEIRSTVAKAPAGYSADIRGAFAPAFNLTEAQVGGLYTDAVPTNSFKSVPGAGVTVNGARTLAKTTPDKFVPVRRTLNHIKYSLKGVTAFATFEPNDDRLWERLSQSVASFLGTFWRSGGLAGARSSEAFYVVCDHTNNTAGTISNGEVHVEVGVALSTPAEFIVINLSQWSGGASSATDSI